MEMSNGMQLGRLLWIRQQPHIDTIYYVNELLLQLDRLFPIKFLMVVFSTIAIVRTDRTKDRQVNKKATYGS